MKNRNNLTLSSDSLNKISFDDFSKATKTLEFDKILNILVSYCPIEAAHGKIFEISPSVSAEEIKKRLKETSEAKLLIQTKSTPSFGGVRDITSHLARADKGSCLSMKDLLDIGALLRVCASLGVYFSTVSEENLLHGYVKRIHENKFLEEKISRCIVSEDIMADTASDTLYEIRRKIKNASNKVKDVLNKYISGDSKYLQENIVTTRNGRYVIPVKAEYKNEIKGLVHDASASGATVFIEPMGVVEANNELRTLEAQEKVEIERILYELTGDCTRFSADLCESFESICAICVIFAKAEFSLAYNCCEPVINNDRYLRLNEARHPLLDKKKVVPTNIYLGKSFTTLVITGPNTGGKTVTLKTIGLLSLMAQSGIHIPANDGSTLPVFDGILADIGDEQSIEQSLSTFSAHMVNIVDILTRYSANSLVLFDELGAGTDPVEGAALAQTILETITERGALCAATTHYAELKAYALDAKNVTNASCEFDIKTLKPTYRLMIGMPGRSNAFAIARKLGLSEGIISRANSKINKETRSFEGLIGKLEEDRIELETQKAHAKKLKEKAQAMFDVSEKQRLEFNKRVEEEGEKAEAKANELLERARESADFVFAQLQEIQRKKDAENFKELLAKSQDEVRKALGIAELNNKIGEKIEAEYVPPRDFVKGDNVLISSLGKEGIIDKIDGEKVTVLIGSARFNTKLKELRLITEKKEDKKKSGSRTPRKIMEAKSEVDVRGFIGDDAIFVVDKFLDDAVLSGLV
ncbi:MAG: endonuclease MutS2, partial [Clostridia bacterium]|nr:endonuclease MutS2 [Clostridia bacterium]